MNKKQNENPNRPKGRGIFTNSWDFQSCEYPSKKTIEVYPTVASDGVFATNKLGSLAKQRGIILRTLINLANKIPRAGTFFNIVTDPLFSFLFKLKGIKYNSSGLITDKNCDFMKDPKFLKAHLDSIGTQYKPGQGAWAFHILQWAADCALGVEGDFVECGVHNGMHSMSNIIYTNFGEIKDRKYYLFDTFKGLDRCFSTEKEFATYDGAYADSYDFVVNRFKEYNNVIIVKGSIPTTLNDVKIKKVAFLAIDMNCVIPEQAALKFFWPKVSNGGIVIFDDYGWPYHEKQKLAIDDFAKSVGAKVLAVPTGQGIIIKR